MTLYSLSLIGLLVTSTQALCDLGTPLRPHQAGQPVKISNYTYVGDLGPLNWANLPGWYNNNICATGTYQSPINLDDTIPAGPVPTISYSNGQVVDLDNIGTCLQAYPPSSNIVRVNNVNYAMGNFHFHVPSEHLLNGVVVPLEMHIVHSANGQNVVLTVLFEISSTASPFIARVLQNESNVRNAGQRVQTGPLNWNPIVNHINAGPRKSYAGSLTTPPCTENTRFIVATETLSITPNQYNKLKAIMKYNSRYLQNSLGATNLLQLSQPNA